MALSKRTIEDVKAKANIVEVISHYVTLKKKGANYEACCPFHNEKSPSFKVSPKDGFYKCFGCGVAGDSITFMMEFVGLDYINAIKTLADMSGVMIEEEFTSPEQQAKEFQKKQHKLNIHDILNKVRDFYRYNLQTNQASKSYLAKRGLSDEIIQKFELGFANDNFHGLAVAFSDYNSNQLLQDAGLVAKNESGKLYDRFRDRIIFPIKNIKGDLIGFGGRITEKGDPKYLNSPETELFSKSLELYGLYEAKKAIMQKNQVIVVEGYMDVIALQQYGVQNVVASMGTAMTDEHVKVLFRLCDNIVCSFDGDVAGKKAAWRGLEKGVSLVSDTKNISFLFLPDEHDPDSFIRKYGVIEFLTQIKDNTQGLIRFLINHCSAEVNLNIEEGKANLIGLVKPYLEQLRSPALQVILKQQLADKVNLPPSTLESILNNRSKYAFFTPKNNNWRNTFIPQTQINILNPYVTIIKNLLRNPLIARVISLPDISRFATLNHNDQQLYKFIRYLELNCDEFSDVVLPDILQMVSFNANVNLAELYTIVAKESSYEREALIEGVDWTGFTKQISDLLHKQTPKRLPRLK